MRLWLIAVVSSLRLVTLFGCGLSGPEGPAGPAGVEGPAGPAGPSGPAGGSGGPSLLGPEAQFEFFQGTAGEVALNQEDPIEGDSSHELVVRDGTTGTALFFGPQVAVNPQLRYRGRISARLVKGAGTFSAGVIAYDRERNPLGEPRYFIVKGQALPATWTLFTAMIKGEGAAANQFPPGTRFVRAVVAHNENNVGTTRVDGFDLQESAGWNAVQAVGTTLVGGAVGGAWVDVPDLSVTVQVNQPASLMITTSGMYGSVNGTGGVRLTVDDVPRIDAYVQGGPSVTNYDSLALSWLQPVGRGSHKVKIQWRLETGVGEIYNGWSDIGRRIHRSLQVIEIPE
jgi:hypothetical protein